MTKKELALTIAANYYSIGEMMMPNDSGSYCDVSSLSH